MISLSLPSVEIKLDADGNARDTEIADTSFSHTLIEMFMVEANDSACRLFSRLNLPHLRRIHPDPAPDALDTLSASLVALGVHPPKDLQHESIQHLLDAVAGRPEETSANYLLLRSLSQATYSPAPLGHFALASREYTHFTSPIRRYADLVVHRLLDDVIKVQRAEPGAIADAINAPDDERLAEIGRHISATERRSQQAEREARHWLLVELMVDRVGESFDAVITGALSIGVFVQLQPMLVEGLVRVADFGGDEWRFDPVSNRFVGRHTGRAIAFGQRMRVILAAVDEMAGELTLLPDRSASIGAGRGVARKSQSTPQAKTQAKGKATSPKRTAKSTARAPRSGKKRSR
jgi:ribonuclease R